MITHTVGYGLLATLTAPLSHHDPDQPDRSNRSLFSRRKQLVASPSVGAAGLEQEALDELMMQHPLPPSVVAQCDLTSLQPAEVVAALLLKHLLDLHNGNGMLDDIDRYTWLEDRSQQAAVQCHSLRAWWAQVCDTMELRGAPAWGDAGYLALVGLPAGFGAQVLEVLAKQCQHALSLARIIRDQAWKDQKEKVEPVAVKLVAEAVKAMPAGVHVADVPVFSANAFRHGLRAAAREWLYDRLGIEPVQLPGQGALPQGVDAFFDNGGNIAKGQKEPAAAYWLAAQAAAENPFVDLLGGCFDGMMTNGSKLLVRAIIVCRENAAYLTGTPAADLPEAGISGADLLDSITYYRHEDSHGSSPMPFTGEALVPGARIWFWAGLRRPVSRLTHGALLATLQQWSAGPVLLGGQSARGYGHVSVEYDTEPDWSDKEALESWLSESTAGEGILGMETRADVLRAGLERGTFGTEQELVRAV